MAAERAGEIARLKANDPELKVVSWIRADVGNEEVARLAEGLDGNTVLQTVRLGGNAKLTDVDRLIAAVGRSGVVSVLLHFTGVGAEKVREMDAVCKTNKERREAATTYFINQAIKLLRSIAATQPDAHKMRHEGSRRGTKDLGLTQEFLDEGPDKRLRPRHVCGGCGEWKSGRLLCAQWKVVRLVLCKRGHSLGWRLSPFGSLGFNYKLWSFRGRY
jgi:hypothetical protein